MTCCQGDGQSAHWQSARGPVCRRHFLTSRAVVRRAFLTATIVGSALLIINQGDALIAGRLSAALWWKVPLTYLVPYLVSTSGALAGARLLTD